jgi:electron transfer flavoprotein beta subunit
VVTVDLRLNEPRFVKMPDIMKAKRKPLEADRLLAISAVEAAARRWRRCSTRHHRSAAAARWWTT